MNLIHYIRIKAIAKKETAHILREPFTLTMALLMPVILVAIFSYAIDFDIRDIKLTVFDHDKSQSSRLLAETFTNSEYFKLSQKDLILTPEEIVRKEKAKIAMIIPEGFEKDFHADLDAKVQLLLDGADNSSIGAIQNYLSGINISANEKLTGKKLVNRIDYKTRYLFNPENRSPWFIVPGLAVVVIAIISILLTALTVAREWERGSMELLLSTPVKPFEIIIGKVTPYLVLSLLGAVLVYLAARLVFNVPFMGSHLLFLFGTVLFLITYLGQGLLISILTKNQQIAMQLSIIAGLLPSILLSGFIYSIDNMTPFWQYFTSILPAKWYMIISRGLYLKGTTIADIKIPLIVLSCMCLFFIGISTKKFTRTLE